MNDYLMTNFGVASVKDIDPTVAQIIIEGADQGNSQDIEVRDAYFKLHGLRRMTALAFENSDLYQKCVQGMGIPVMVA